MDDRIDKMLKELELYKRYTTTIDGKIIFIEIRGDKLLLSTITYNAMGVPKYSYNNMTLTEVIRHMRKELKGVGAK